MGDRLIMKEYHVVKIYSDGGYRNNQYICRCNSRNIQESLEMVMNIYAQNGWTVKEITELSDENNYRYAYITFEK